jgi:exonuclease SbcC
MIPLKLQLKNFLSYGPELQTIEFHSYPLICLSGKNGHGKSALLDAITWALWGQARKPFGAAKPDQSLLHLGQTHMLVILDFVFNEQTYRIRREFSKSYGKATASVDFGSIDSQTGSFIALTDKTIKTTQDKIERMLNLDMESFVNSAFLRQGQANEFSKKSAKDRKTVLATILGLNHYESLRVLAHEKIKEATNAKYLCTALQEKRLTELEKKNEIIALLHEHNQKITDITSQEQELHKTEKIIEKEQKELTEKEQKYALARYEKELVQQKELELQKALITELHAWKKTNRSLLKLPDKQSIETQKQHLIDTINTCQQQLQKGLEIKTELLTLKEAVHLRSVELKSTHTIQLQTKKLTIEQLLLEQNHCEKQITEQIAAIAAQTNQIEHLTKENTRLEKTISELSCQKPRYIAVEKQFEKRREYYQTFIADGNQIKQKLTELAQKKKMVQDEHNPSCPLCEQNLSASRKRFLNETILASEQFLSHRLARLTTIISSLKALLLTQHEQIKEIKQQAEQQDRCAMQAEEIRKQIQVIQTTLLQKKQLLGQDEIVLQSKSQQIAQAQAEYSMLITTEHNAIQHDAELKKLTALMAGLEKAYTAIAYEKEKHLRAQDELNAIEQTLAHYTDIIQSQPLQEQRKKTVEQLCIALKTIKKQQIMLAKTLATFTSLEHDTATLVEKEKSLRSRQKEVSVLKDEILQRKGSLENQKSKLIILEKEFEDEQKNINALTKTIDDYHIIATATGKNGIQALLIEEAIPEIEQEANELLARLTNNQSHIIIESLRDLKSGGTKETLDIKISDAIGIRPYELFSGGEAFRIDFALRIAISKLLARRAGTSLQTLIIDEGFGSQDEDGLHNIMEALYKIQDDFSKIIIVSHLPAMKDQFPVQFLVEKNAHGSHVRIMEQG